MPKTIKLYVRLVDELNRWVGRIAMYLLFVLMAFQLVSSLRKSLNIPYSFWQSINITDPSIWTLEMSQFTLLAYLFLGGAYSLQLGSNVRMDLVYGGWSDKTKAFVDALTIFALIFYLCVLLYGGLSASSYALEYGERNATTWRPYMAPIKIIMCIGIFLMLLQAFSIFLKDLAKIWGEEL